MEYSNVKLKKQIIITVGREYGAGGRTSAKLLAKALNIHYYDDEILKLASEESAINEELFRLADEKAPEHSILSLITRNKQKELTDIDTKNITSPDNLFKFQSSVIRGLAEKDNFIILGRCANYILEDQHKDKVLRLYLYADFETRVKRIMEQKSISIDDAYFKVRKKDKNRAEFYKYFTDTDIKEPTKYDIMLNTSTINFDEIVEILMNFLHTRGFIDF